MAQDYNPNPREGNRTKTILFTRQLRPQPPPDARPYWYGLGELAFYKDREKIWNQKIPEAQHTMRFNRYGAKSLEHPGRGMKVEFNQHWGWLLTFEISHRDADNIWAFILSPDFREGKHLIEKEEDSQNIGDKAQ